MDSGLESARYARQGRVDEIGRVIRHRMPAFMDVEDDTTCKDSVDHTGQSATP